MIEAVSSKGLARALAAAAAMAVLAGCANTGRPDSVVVGAVPDDYRTNHPIVIAEKDMVLDLPVGATDRGMTGTQKVALGGFLTDYDRRAAPALTIMSPVGSRNASAASHAASEFARYAQRQGVPASRIHLSSYQAEAVNVSAPVRVMFTAMTAQTNKCGRWPEDIADTTDNKHYANFGCSYQNNLAAQIANPADLLGPRKMTEIDAANRDRVIEVYQRREISGEFLGGSEVEY
jgi:pilus assembly protein CpaD